MSRPDGQPNAGPTIFSSQTCLVLISSNDPEGYLKSKLWKSKIINIDQIYGTGTIVLTVVVGDIEYQTLPNISI